MTDSDRIDAAVRRYNQTGDFGIPLDVLCELELVLDESGETIRFGSATGEHLRRRARYLERRLAPHTN